MSTVTVSGLSKSYGGPPVLSSVDLVVPDGTIMAVLGASGCGKTTMLRVIAGFIAPDEGTVAFDGRPVTGAGVFVAPQHRRIGGDGENRRNGIDRENNVGQLQK